MNNRLNDGVGFRRILDRRYSRGVLVADKRETMGHSDNEFHCPCDEPQLLVEVDKLGRYRRFVGAEVAVEGE